MKNNLKKISILKWLILFFRLFKVKPGFLERLKNFSGFMGDYKKFKTLDTNENISAKTENLFPRIFDKTKITNLDPVYFIQGSWCAKKIFENKPIKHFDIGSQAQMVGIISQFVPTTMVDIRPLSIKLDGLSFVKGDILSLPFANKSINSLSSICVIEHIGLGRYGDTLDQFGTEKAAKELCRVLSDTGNLYVSVPIDSENKVYFNAHRAFTRDYLLSLFNDLKLVEEKYIYGNDLVDRYDMKKGFGTGLYYFKK